MNDVVTTYYEIIEDTTYDPDRMRAILAPDLDFQGTIAGAITGAEPFIQGVGGFAESQSGLTMLHRLDQGDEVATLYDGQMPGGPVRFAEFFRIVDGRIASLRLLYDGGDYVAKGGR